MGERPRSPGFIQSISKAQLKVVGLLDAAGNPIGGGGRFTSWKTVGVDSSCDYATVSAGLAAGQYGLIVTSSITETVGVAALPNVDVSITFESPAFTWTFNDGIEIVATSYTSIFSVNLNGGTIAWGNTATSKYPFDLGADAAFFTLHGSGTLTNTSTSVTTPLVNNVCNQGYHGTYVINAANVNLGGIYCSKSFYADALKFNGGGTSCQSALSVTAVETSWIGRAEFHGSFSASGSAWPLGVTPDVTIGSLYMNTLSGSTPIQISGAVLDYDQHGTNTVTLSLGANVHRGRQSNGAATVTIPAAYNDERRYIDVDAGYQRNWSIEPGKIIYQQLDTTDATQTEFLINGTDRFTLLADTTALCNVMLLSQRDNQDWASFQYLNCILAEDSGYTVTNGTASAGPDHSKGTGSTLRLAIDASSGLRFRITSNAAQNWSHKLVVKYIVLTN